MQEHFKYAKVNASWKHVNTYLQYISQPDTHAEIAGITLRRMDRLAPDGCLRLPVLFKQSKDQGEEDNSSQLMTHSQKFDLTLKLTWTPQILIRAQNKLSFLCRHVHSFSHTCVVKSAKTLLHDLMRRHTHFSKPLSQRINSDRSMLKSLS